MLAHFIESKPFQCGYFQDRQSLFEEYLLEDISEVEFEYLLAHGMRHFGEYFFRPRCNGCFSCVPIRVRTDEFQLTRSQRRAVRDCGEVETRMGLPSYSKEKFRLYLDHKKRFHTLQDDVEDEQNFRLSFYVNTPFGMEFEYYHQGRLVGVALADITRRAFSAVYTFYSNPTPKMSLGTLSIVKQIEFCRNRGIPYYYMGYFISHNHSLAYKANYRPNEIYVSNEWRPFRNAPGDYLIPDDQVQWINTDSLVKAASQPTKLFDNF